MSKDPNKLVHALFELRECKKALANVIAERNLLEAKLKELGVTIIYMEEASKMVIVTPSPKVKFKKSRTLSKKVSNLLESIGAGRPGK